MAKGENNSETLRKLISRDQGVFAFGVESALSARVAEMAGAECIYAGGYSASGVNMWPDMGIFTVTEMLEHMRRVTQKVQVPVLVDIDDGYGNPLNVQRTVTDFLETTDAAALHIEDQRFPKRCGHIAGKEILPLEEFLGKLKMAVDTIAETRDVVLVARTDAYNAAGGKKDPKLGGDIEEALRRGRAYADCGADLLWCEFNDTTRQSVEAFAEGMQKTHSDVPLAFNYSPSLSWHKQENPITFEDLNALNYKFVFCTYPALQALTFAVYECALRFKKVGAEALWEMQRARIGHPMEKFMNVVGVGEYQRLEREYSPGACERQATSEGFKI